jgi:hypothetical protein
LIYLAARHSFYISFYERYLQIFFTPGEFSSFLDAQRVVSTLETKGIRYEVTSLKFFHTIKQSDTLTLERYLSKCTFDLRSVEFWLGHPPMGDFLQSFIFDGWYRFPQEVWLIQFKGKGNSSIHSPAEPSHPDFTKI